MSTSESPAGPPPRQASMVGDYRRGSRVRTTRAGTWFPATGPDDEPAGLLLLHPGVKPSVLTTILRRLASLGLRGVLPMLPELVDQAGRGWLVATEAVVPTLAELLEEGEHRTPANAAILLHDLACTLAAVHVAGIVHGAVGAPAVVIGRGGNALLADWGTDAKATSGTDRIAFGELARLLAQRWGDEGPGTRQLDEIATAAAAGTGLAELTARLAGLAGQGDRTALAAARPAAPTPRRTRPTPRPTYVDPVDLDQLEPPTPVAARAGSSARDTPAAASPATAPTPWSEPAAGPAHPVGPAPSGADPLGSDSLGSARSGSARSGADPLGSAGAGDLLRELAGRLSAAVRGQNSRHPLRPSAVLGMLLVCIAVAALLVIVRPGHDERPAAPAAAATPTSRLEVRSVAVASRLEASVCVLVGTVTTNGQSGRVIYRWVGRNSTLAMSSVSAGSYNYQVEIALMWPPGDPPLAGGFFSLEILTPTPSTTAAVVPVRCV